MIEHDDSTGKPAESSGAAAGVLDYSDPRRDPKPKTRWAELLVAAAICALLVAILVPSLGRQRGPANRIRCASNLRQIGLALMIYSNAHGGVYPPTLDEVLADGEITGEVFVCPHTAHQPATGPTTQAVVQDFRKPGHNSYVYVAGGVPEKSLTGRHVVAHDLPLNHPGLGMNALFGDGHVEWLPQAQAARVIAELQAGFNPPRPPATQTTQPTGN
jgi:prepilin-type processing-associated H-X9-DG protein